MNYKKLEALQFKAGIHTVSIRSKQESCLHKEDVKWIAVERPYTQQLKDGSRSLWYSYQLNLNKLAGHEVWSLQEFGQLIRQATQAMGLDRWQYVRIDTRFDMYANDYEEYLKLMRLLVLLVAQEHGLTNRYESFDPLTFDKETVTAKKRGHQLEVEYYNKQLESPGYPAKSRLELRTGKIYGYAAQDTKNIIAEWGGRINRSIAGYEQLQKTCNECLLRRWEVDKKAGTVRSRNDFIRRYQSNIFTKQQLVELLEALGCENPKKSAENIKSRERKMEFFTQRDLETLLHKLIDSMKVYFETEPAAQEPLKKEYSALSEKVEKVA